MIHTYLADITPLFEEEIYERCCEKAPLWRKEKAGRLLTELGRAQSIGVWTLLEMAQKEIGADERNLFNLSHSGKYVLCALSDEKSQAVKVGCDVEIIEELHLNIAKRFFTAQEYERILLGKTQAEQTDLFFRFWVLKESFMKATRLGMALDTRAFEIEIPEIGSPLLVNQPAEFSEIYYYKEYEVKDINAKIAICTTDEIIGEELRILELVNG